VVGVGDAETVRRIGEIFALHRLALEDCINVHQRPKVEEYEDHRFIVSRMAMIREGPDTEQISLFLGRNFVITFQEQPGDCFGPVRERLRAARGRIRAAGADYLAYALLDAIVDSYFPVLESYGERIEDLEDDVLLRPDNRTVAQIFELKRDLLALRRAAWPQREAINTLIREPSPLIDDETRIFLRDCYDHAVHVLDIVETHREQAASLTDVYLSSMSNRLNEVMKVLTIIATIFIPLSFIASVYGMNFDTERSPWNMPELEWYFGYPFALGLMALTAAGLLLFFRRKGWIGSGRSGAGEK
jgi:magnesium transporter